MEGISYQSYLFAAGTGCVYCVWRLREWYRTRSSGLKDIPGPDPESRSLGNMRQLFQSEVGEMDFQWQEQYGGIVRVKGPFGEDRLWVADIKAVHHILQGYNWAREPARREIARSLSGQGILWADGETHKRQRKVVQPAFGAGETKALLPIFRGCVERVTSKWKVILTGTSEPEEIIDVSSWLTRVALDAIGEAGYGSNFGALDNAESEFARTYHNLVAGAFGVPSKLKILIVAMSPYLPHWMLDLMYDYFPGEGLARARENRRIATKAAKGLIEAKIQENRDGKSSRDILTLLVNANKSFDKQTRLSDAELLAQMRTFVVVGHETTANTLTFGFLELAKHPEVQVRLRNEIRATRAAIRVRGDTDLTHSDYEGMAYLNAFIKEILRMHPVAFNVYRKTSTDDVLPLYNPIRTVSGKVITEVPVPRGLNVVVSIAATNRDKTLWGEDAQEFKPERWLKTQPRKGPNAGIYGNMLSFGGGPRSCLGYRFAVLEMQTFLVELINHFELDMSEASNKIKRQASIVMVATVRGEEEKGVQMPLKVKFAPPEEDL